jgi:agmatinase
LTNFGGAIKERERYDIVLLGFPFDEKSSYLKGPAKGPQAIREASTEEAINAWTELGFNLEEDAAVGDLGDLDVKGDFQEVFKRAEEKIQSILREGTVPFVLGGDHSITYPIVKAFSKHYENLDVLHFDAHPDLYDELYGDRYSHACPFARIIEDGLVRNLVQVGIRAATGAHRKKASEYNVRMIEMKDMSDILRLKFKNPLFISFDIDALDPAFAPGVSHHEPGGLSTRQVIQTLHALDAQIVGMDLVEVNPERDWEGMTAAAAVKIIMETMGKVVQRRLKEKEIK